MTRCPSGGWPVGERIRMKLRAIIFDDEPTVRQVLREICNRRGYEVFTFPDVGLCPLADLEHCPCPAGACCADIVISDVRMPKMNGIDFVASLLSKGCTRPHFCLISGSWSAADSARAADLGCKVLAKPFRTSDLVEWLQEVEAQIAPERRLFDWC